MPTKVRIIEQIGAKGLLLPELINRGLAAHDRLKYYMTLLQTATAHAHTPNQPTGNLREEREASGIADAMFDQIVPGTRSLAPDLYVIPSASKVIEQMFADLRQMVEPLHVAATTRVELRERLDAYQRRIDERISQTPHSDDDHVLSRTIDALTRRITNGQDSMHQLVMDLHWELNRLQSGVAMESVDGARAYGLTDADRPLVRAFMRGVNETAALKFDHPGLGTTATREGDRLSIQNDLGTSDAHVVVVHVSGLSATVIYTDTHRSRAVFLQRLLEGQNVQWETSGPAASGGYEMLVGRYTGQDQDDLEQYLTFLGSRLVFLLDWNRARKRLARFVKQTDAVMLLKWAADNNIGHCAFLQAGDIHLINTALERAAPVQMHVNCRLDELIGRDSANTFLMRVLAIVSAGLTSHRSLRLINDEIEAELLTYLETADQTVLSATADHAMLLSALSDRLRGALTLLKGQDGFDEVARTADVAKAWETRASEIVRRSSRLLEQTNDGHHLRRLLTEASTVSEMLEQAAFKLTLFPEQTDPKGVALLDDLADLVSQSTRAYVRCIADAREIRRATTRSELERLLITVDRLADLEHESDTAQRVLETTLMRGRGDFRQLHVLSGTAHAFHQAIGSLARCSLIVRDYVLNTASGGK